MKWYAFLYLSLTAPIYQTPPFGCRMRALSLCRFVPLSAWKGAPVGSQWTALGAASQTCHLCHVPGQPNEGC